jgi:DNA-binding IclR family transcriptional regulator
LHHATDETVYAAVALGSTISIVASHESTTRLRVGSSFEVGDAASPHATAAGKALLAFCDAAELPDYFDDHQLEPLTELAITDWDDLVREPDQTRARGVALEREESDVGIAGVGAVIIGKRGEPVGAYAAAMPVARFDDAIESVSTAMSKAGDDASRALGYRREYPPKDARSRHRTTSKPFVSL